jgi:apolipoprotein N-acyltransferase
MDSPINVRYPVSAGIGSALLSAIFFYFGTGLHPHWWLTWLAAIPLLLLSYCAPAKWAFIVSFVSFALGSLNLWRYFEILDLPIVIRLEAFLGPALIFASGIMLSRAFFLRGYRWLAALSLPAVWMSFEFIASFGPNGTALNLAYSQMNFLPVLQIASVTGIWGISFIVLFFSSAIAVALSSKSKTFAAASLAIVIAVLAFGAARLAIHHDGERVTIGLAATDRKPLLANQESDAAGIVQAYVEAIDQLAARGAQVVVIPEKIGPTMSDSSGPTLDAFSQAAAKNHVIVVVGLDHLDRPLKHNMSYVFAPNGKLEKAYEKHYMVPHWEDGYERGTTIAILPDPHPHWATAICKDMDFPTLSRRYAQRGTGLLFVPAWDFTVDDWLHGRMAILRGVEAGFAIARSAKQGLMTITDNRGRVLAQQHSSVGMATLLGEITVSPDLTLYARFGDWFAWLVLAGTAILLLSLVARRGSFHSYRTTETRPR